MQTNNEAMSVQTSSQSEAIFTSLKLHFAPKRNIPPNTTQVTTNLSREEGIDRSKKGEIFPQKKN